MREWSKLIWTKIKNDLDNEDNLTKEENLRHEDNLQNERSLVIFGVLRINK